MKSWGTSVKSGMGRGTLGEVRDVLGLVGGPSERFETSRGTLGEVRDGSRDPQGGPERPRDTRIDRGTLGEDRGTLGEVRVTLGLDS